ncbi:MAG: hypothetical protein RXP28_07315 [Nitrososphaeria archaeon]
MKVTEAVKKIVDENVLYQILLSSGLANLNAMAREIKSAVDSMTGKEVKLNTIEKALTKLSTIKTESYTVSTSGTEVELETGISEVTYTLDEFSGVDFTKLIMAVMDEGKIKAIVKGGNQASELVLLKVKFVGAKHDVPYHPLIMVFNALNVNLLHAFRFDRNVYFIMPRKDSVKALSVIEKLR